MADDHDILKAIESLQKDMATKSDLEAIKKDMATKQDIQRVEQNQARTNTALEAVAAGQKELQETVATKADVLTVGVKVDKLRKRIEGLKNIQEVPPLIRTNPLLCFRRLFFIVRHDIISSATKSRLWRL